MALSSSLSRLTIFSVMCYGGIFCYGFDHPSLTLKISPQLPVYTIGQKIDLNCQFNSVTPVKTTPVSFYMVKGHRYRGISINSAHNVTAEDNGSIIYCEVWCSEMKNQTRYALTSNEIKLFVNVSTNIMENQPVSNVFIKTLNTSSLRVGDTVQCYTKKNVNQMEIYTIKGKTKKLLTFMKNGRKYYVSNNFLSYYIYYVNYTLTACENDTKIFCSVFQDSDNFNSSEEMHIVMEHTESDQDCDVDSCFHIYNGTKNIVLAISGILLGIISITLLVLFCRQKYRQNSGACLKNLFKKKSDLYDKGNVDDKVLYAEIEIDQRRIIKTPVLREQTPYATIIGVMKPKPNARNK